MSLGADQQASPAKRRRPNNGSENFSCLEKALPKIVNDSVHGHLELSPACVAVIDTKQFQRLRFIKQTGFCYFVYPGASHNRFEHSLGVCHLAGQLVRSLKNNQPCLDIDPKDILCVELAGLCHDLGHGPFSHAFDGKFIPQIRSDITKWEHEQASIDMFDYLIKENNLMQHPAFVDEHIDENDITFIKEMIYGPLKPPEDEDEDEDNKKWPYLGRGEEKSFLYEIVSNKRNGIDVDKWDYFARDCHHFGIRNNFDHNRYIKFIRVLKVNGRLALCARDKEIGNLYQMFYTRYTLHRSAYQHKVNCSIEIMMVDAMLKANDHLLFQGSNGQKLKMSECISDMKAYSQLTDHILWDICLSDEPQMEDAKRIVDRILSRDLYCFLEERPMRGKLLEELKDEKIDLDDLRDDLIEISRSDSTHETLKISDFRLQIVKLDFGMKESNPLEKMWYYYKSDPNTATRIDEGGLLKPPRFKDSLLRIYSCLRSSQTNEFIKSCFKQFLEKKDMAGSTNSWGYEGFATPKKKPDSGDQKGTPCSAGKMRAKSSNM